MTFGPAFRHGMRTFLALSLLLLPGCAGLLPFGEERSQRWIPVDVEVREDPVSDVWSVSFRLPVAAAGVEMMRSRGGAFRGELWSAAAAGTEARWHREGATERLCFDRPASSFSVAFHSDPRPRTKDYELNVPFTDGSRLLYTGHLMVRPLVDCGAGPGGAGAEALPGNVAHRWRFVTSPERLVRVLDQSAAGELTWVPAPGHRDGETYAYFGSLPGVETPRMALLLDPGLPPWLARDVERLVPALVDHFAAEMALELSFAPLLLVSFGGDEGAGLSFSGGTLDGLIQVALRGSGWLEESPEARRKWFHHLAHEAFHFWAGELLRPDHESEWLSEAAAELFALEAARRFGVLDEREVAGVLVEKANQCLAGLGGAALLEAPERGAWDTFYSCGPVILFVAGAAVERGGGAGRPLPGADGSRPAEGSDPDGLATLFRHVLDEGLHRGETLSTGLFLGWLDQLSGDRDTVLYLQRLIRYGVEERADVYLHALLHQAGLELSLVPVEEAEQAPELYQALLAEALKRCACGDGAALGSDLTVPEGIGPDECAVLSGGGPIWRLDDVDAHREPRQAWLRLRSAAARQHPVRVVAGEGSAPLLLLCSGESMTGSFEGMLRLD